MTQNGHFVRDTCRHKLEDRACTTNTLRSGSITRMSNLLAAVGRGQLRTLGRKVGKRRAVFDRYLASLGQLSGLFFMPQAHYGTSTRWLTVALIDPESFGTSSRQLVETLESSNIEARPAWKPMHLQPVFATAQCVGGVVAETIFRDGICLPSGSSLSEADQLRVIDVIGSAHS